MIKGEVLHSVVKSIHWISSDHQILHACSQICKWIISHFSLIWTFLKSPLLVNSFRISCLPRWKIHCLGENFLGRCFVLGELCIKKNRRHACKRSHKRKLTDGSDNGSSEGMRIWKHSRSVKCSGGSFGGFPTDGFLSNRLIWYLRLIWAYYYSMEKTVALLSTLAWRI